MIFLFSFFLSFFVRGKLKEVSHSNQEVLEERRGEAGWKENGCVYQLLCAEFIVSLFTHAFSSEVLLVILIVFINVCLMDSVSFINVSTDIDFIDIPTDLECHERPFLVLILITMSSNHRDLLRHFSSNTFSWEREMRVINYSRLSISLMRSTLTVWLQL